MLKQMDRQALIAAIRRDIPGMDESWYDTYAERIVHQTDPRLEENVAQWAAGAPISDVWIGDYCIGMVMKIRGSRDFLSALEALNHYAEDPAQGERLIWRARR